MSKQLRKDSQRLTRARGQSDVGRRKQFSTTDYTESAPAVAAVLTHLHSLGIHAISNPDIYGPDIVTYSGLRPATYIEVEQRRGWSGGADWPVSWDPVRIPERKWEMYTRLGLPTAHWVVAADCSRALTAVVDHTTPATLSEVSNSVHAEGEKFYCIGLQHWAEILLLTSGD